MDIYKTIYKEIKKYDNIVIARHIGPDPDALGSQLALKETILETFPNKKVYAIGSPALRFKFMGELDKIDEIPENTLLIALDTPDSKRLDGLEDIKKYQSIIKIDHHPFVESFENISFIDDSASSTCQMILELINNTKLKLTKKIAENIYLGIVADTARFLHDYTSVKTFELVTDLLRKSKIDFTSLYRKFYLKPYSEVKFEGYILQNLNITDNGVGYIVIKDDILKEFGVDSSSPGNMIGNLGNINEILVWVIFTEDVKANLIKVNIRSRGPIINELASKYNGGGHKFASGAKLTSFDQIEHMIVELDEITKKYNEENR